MYYARRINYDAIYRARREAQEQSMSRFDNNARPIM